MLKGRSGWLLFLPFLLPYTKWWSFTGEAAPGRGSFSFGSGLSGGDVTWGSCLESTDQHPAATICILLSKVSVPSAPLPQPEMTRNVQQCIASVDGGVRIFSCGSLCTSTHLAAKENVCRMEVL